MGSNRSKRGTRGTGVVVALVGLVLTAAACGAEDHGDGAAVDGVASLRDASAEETDGETSDQAADSTSGGELDAPEDPDEAFALFNECLEEHGVDVGDGFVVAGGDVALDVAPANRAEAGDGQATQVFVAGEGPGGTLPEIDEDFLAANEECQPHLANVTRGFDLTPEQEAAMEDAQLAFQQCMSEHGIDGGGFSIAIGAGPALEVEEGPDAERVPPPSIEDIDPEQFAAAAEECQSVYDEYPELDGVLPDGGPGVFAGRVENMDDE